MDHHHLQQHLQQQEHEQQQRSLYYDEIPDIIPYEDYDHHKVSINLLLLICSLYQLYN